jgi:hypothetical protein
MSDEYFSRAEFSAEIELTRRHIVEWLQANYGNDETDDMLDAIKRGIVSAIRRVDTYNALMLGLLILYGICSTLKNG